MNVLTLSHVTDAAAIDRALDCFADLLLVAAKEPLAIADRFIFAGEASIDDLLQSAFLGRVVGSGTLANPQVPLTKQAHLLGGIALGHHAGHEVLVLLDFVGTGFGVEADHGQ